MTANESVPTITGSGARTIGRVSGAGEGRVEKNLVMTPEADDFLANLSRQTGLKEGDVLRLALVLFKTAVDAREQGQHVGLAADPNALDVELVGF